MLTNQPRTLAWEPLDSAHVLACPRVPYLSVRGIIENAGKAKWLIGIQQKAKHDCCRKTDNLDIEAWYSNAEQRDKGTPDIYKFYCKVCEQHPDAGGDRGYCHVQFCVGGTHPLGFLHGINARSDLFDIRPKWSAR
ncbi:MAG: hypothetical protein ABFE08_17765 [Armatimonadia bacterium]